MGFRAALLVLAVSGAAACGASACLLTVSTRGLAGDPLVEDGDAADGAPADAGDAADAPSDAAPSDARTVPDGAVVFAANGHAYRIDVVPTGISWTEARDRAVGLGGHLVTVGSLEENTFVLALAKARTDAFRGNGTGPWLGGFQTSIDGGAPDQGWQWVDDTPWSFTAWRGGQPDDTLGLENYLDLYAPGGTDMGWNDDALDSTEPRNISMLVEFE